METRVLLLSSSLFTIISVLLLFSLSAVSSEVTLGVDSKTVAHDFHGSYKENSETPSTRGESQSREQLEVMAPQQNLSEELKTREVRHLLQDHQIIIRMLQNLLQGQQLNSQPLQNVTTLVSGVPQPFDKPEALKRAIAAPTSKCGGLVNLTDSFHELHYRIPRGRPKVSCIWILWCEDWSKFRISNLQNGVTEFHESFQLFHGSYKLELGETRETEAYLTYSLLFFNANRTSEVDQGFHFTIARTGINPTLDPSVSSIQLTTDFSAFQGFSGSYKYPTSGSYKSNELVFLVGRAAYGKSLYWKLETDTKEFRATVYIEWLDGSWVRRYECSGNATIEAEGPPFSIAYGTRYIVYFTSDPYHENPVGTGFRFTYSYE